MITTDTRAGHAALDPSHRPREGSLPRRIVTAILVGLVIAYQRVVSPWLPDTCRFEPSCSQYARDALVAHGPLRGLWLATRRIARCHPLGGQGYDPVPPRAGSDDVRTVVES